MDSWVLLSLFGLKSSVTCIYFLGRIVPNRAVESFLCWCLCPFIISNVSSVFFVLFRSTVFLSGTLTALAAKPFCCPVADETSSESMVCSWLLCLIIVGPLGEAKFILAVLSWHYTFVSRLRQEMNTYKLNLRIHTHAPIFIFSFWTCILKYMDASSQIPQQEVSASHSF